MADRAFAVSAALLISASALMLAAASASAEPKVNMLH